MIKRFCYMNLLDIKYIFAHLKTQYINKSINNGVLRYDRIV